MRAAAAAGPERPGGRQLTARLALVGDLLVPLGAILTLVTAVGTVHWLKGKRRLALLAPLSIVSVVGIAGVLRVAKPDSPWARWRYDADRMAQARTRFGGSGEAVERAGRGSAAGLGTVVVGVLGGVPLGAVTSLAGGVLLGHAVLAAAGRPLSARVCLVVAAVLAVAEAVVVVVELPDRATLPGAAATVVVLVGAVLLARAGGP